MSVTVNLLQTESLKSLCTECFFKCIRYISNNIYSAYVYHLIAFAKEPCVCKEKSNLKSLLDRGCIELLFCSAIYIFTLHYFRLHAYLDMQYIFCFTNSRTLLLLLRQIFNNGLFIFELEKVNRVAILLIVG